MVITKGWKSLHCMNPEKWFFLEVYRFKLRLRILQILIRLFCSNFCPSFEIDFLSKEAYHLMPQNKCIFINVSIHHENSALSFFILLTLIFLLPKCPIMILLEFMVPCEKNGWPLKSSSQSMTASWEERVSCKKNIPVFAIFSLQYPHTLIRFFDELSPLTLLDQNFKL